MMTTRAPLRLREIVSFVGTGKGKIGVVAERA